LKFDGVNQDWSVKGHHCI